eukprot:TRINITY_DN13581_c0_g1_i1.p2 TRINITY_DN13581_c0_g1~~TRINITY_DN13581_c0_g1_i1.p2  ORF type:complete len:233 (+),score=77.21 TRINITY_DN13581_c0_g1_i1:49-747(+)
MYIVTGVSRGLGRAVVANLLEANQRVVGIGRSNPFGERIAFVECDFADAAAVERLEVDVSGAGEGGVTLINNAGILGELGRMSEVDTQLEKVMQVNVLAPMKLTMKVYAGLPAAAAFRLVNISSGAAHRSTPAWSAYCASKAALHRLSENFYLEEQERGRNVAVYSVAPGVIDTGMQDQIRATPKEAFSGVGRFVELKQSNALYSPEECAQRLLDLLARPYAGAVQYDLRDL